MNVTKNSIPILHKLHLVDKLTMMPTVVIAFLVKQSDEKMPQK